MKKGLFAGMLISIILIVIVGFLIFPLENKEFEPNIKTNYKMALESLEKGNQWVIKTDYNEHCRSNYRYYDRGCYYDYDAKDRPSDIIVSYSDLKLFNLTSSQNLEICKKLAHKGEAANCLNHYNYDDECLILAESISGQYCSEYDSESNTQPPACLIFRDNSEYLKRVCSLEPGELIYSRGYSPSQEECNTNGCFPHMSYTTFI